MNNNTQKIAALVDPIVKEENCDLVDIEIVFEAGRKIVRLYIDKTEGVTLEDCTKVSHAVEDVLEVEGLVEGRYHLEVSSPGLNRPLTKEEHFRKALGHKVNVLTIEKINGRRRYQGVLTGIEEGELIIHIDNQDFRVPLTKLSKANLEYEFQ